MKRRHFVLVMFFVPLLLFLLPGMYAGGAILAGSISWLVLLPTMATTLNRISAERSPEHLNGMARCLAIIWWPTIGLLTAAYGLALQMAVL